MIGNKTIFRKEVRTLICFELYIILMVHLALEIEHFDIYYIETMAEQTSSEYRFN